MEDSLIGLIDKYFTSIIAVMGTLSGILVTQIFNIFSKNKDYNLKVSEKILDKRIDANESILEISKRMRAITAINKDSGNFDSPVETYPIIFESKKDFNDFFNEFSRVLNSKSHFLSIELFRYLNFVQDYFLTIDQWFRDSDGNDFPRIGIVIKEDLIDFSSQITNHAMLFFEKGAYEKKYINQSRKYHKYTKEKTDLLLSNTLLISKQEELDKFKIAGIL